MTAVLFLLQCSSTTEKVCYPAFTSILPGIAQQEFFCAAFHKHLSAFSQPNQNHLPDNVGSVGWVRCTLIPFSDQMQKKSACLESAK